MKNLSLLLVFICCTTISLAQWKPLGPNAGLLSPPNGDDLQPDIATNSAGTPYIVYTERTNVYTTHLRLRIKKFDGNNWVDVGTPSYAFRGTVPSIYITAKDTVYVGYLYSRTDDLKPRVIKFNGTTWDFVGGPIPYTGSLGETSLVVDTNGKPYMGLGNFPSGGGGNIMTYDGNDWVAAGNTAFVANTSYISLRINPNTNELYVGYDSYFSSWNAGGVRRYNGTSWDTIGPALNNMWNIDLAPDGSIYALHTGTNCMAVVSKFVNGSWVAQGGPTGVYCTAHFIRQIVLDESGNPYLVFGEGNGNGIFASVKKLVGNTWSYVGLPSFSTTDVTAPNLAFGKTVPYITYNDSPTLNRKVSCMYYDSTILSVAPLANFNIKVYPNPAHDFVTVSLGNTLANTAILLKDFMGRTILTYQTDNNKTIRLNTSSICPGLYFLSVVQYGASIATEKIVVE